MVAGKQQVDTIGNTSLMIKLIKCLYRKYLAFLIWDYKRRQAYFKEQGDYEDAMNCGAMAGDLMRKLLDSKRGKK